MSPDYDAAMKRLNASLSQFETALAHHLELGQGQSHLETELQIMQDDRARLAVELEAVSARLGRAETAADHVEHRVGAAVELVRAVLERAGSPDGASERSRTADPDEAAEPDLPAEPNRPAGPDREAES